jgi:hypothetical protein
MLQAPGKQADNAYIILTCFLQVTSYVTALENAAVVTPAFDPVYCQISSLRWVGYVEPRVGSMTSVFLGNSFRCGFFPLNRPADQGVGSLLQMPEALVVLETAIQLAADVPDAPSAKGQNDDAEFITPVGKGIGGSRGVIAVELATYEAMGLKRFQTIREHVGRHAGQTFLEVLKPHRAGEEVTDDQ